MTADVKGLDYYLENPSELPDHYSIEQLTAMAEANEVAEEEEPPQSEEVSETDVTEEAQPTKEEVEDDAENAPIQSKDGKHTIPYAVLVKEREQRQQAEAAIKSMQERIATLESGKATEVTPDQTDIDMEEFKSDFPELAPMFNKLAVKIGALESQLTLERSKVQDEVIAKQQSTVQDLIDANPTLSFWQNENAELFSQAVQFDELLQADPKNSALSAEQRFIKVVAAVEAVNGKTELPDSYKPQESKQEIAERAKKVIEKVPAHKPKTLSDIPGGTPPKADEMENIAEMSPNKLNAMMASMTPDQIADLLSKFG